jgi:hypothetical protein
MKWIRSASEAEVISEFLKCEYHQRQYHADRAQHESIVMSPDLGDLRDNELRRELLFRRHRVTWNELPADVNWSLVSLDPEDIGRLRVFPRGHWPKMANGSDLTVQGLANSIRTRKFSGRTTDDVSSVQALSYRMRQGREESSIILIGVDQHEPLTILEGNHRMIAAALISDQKISEFRTYCGFSPHMAECFWYQGTGHEAFLRHAWRRAKSIQPRLIAAMKKPLLSE